MESRLDCTLFPFFYVNWLCEWMPLFDSHDNISIAWLTQWPSLAILHFEFLSWFFTPSCWCSYALRRCQGTLRTMDIVWMSLFLREHLLMSANKICMLQRWLWGKLSSLQVVVKAWDLNLVRFYETILIYIQFALLMLNTKFWSLNRYVTGTCQKRKKCWNKTRWGSWYIHEGTLLSF